MVVPSPISKSFRRDQRGSIAIIFAAALPLLLMIAGGVIDYANAISKRQRLQEAIDAAALAAGRELGLSDARRENVAAAVEAMVFRMMVANGQSLPSIETTVTSDPLEVRVAARQTIKPLFGGAFGLAPGDVAASALARIIGRPNICLLGLDPSSAGTISLEKEAKVTGQNCAVFSNSAHAHSIKSKNSANLTASLICAVGGKDGGKANFAPEPLTDCPSFDDPLAGRPEPQVGNCDPSLPTRLTGSVSLHPGTYCGGLSLEAGAQVALDPGVYVIKNGPLLVGDGARLTGSGVSFFLTGTGAVLTFARQSSIDLNATKDGSMAGLLVFEARSQPESGVHQILSDDARNLLGTIYLPRGRLHIDANNPIADQSAYTAIVARQVTLYGGPHLVLNSNYDMTDVPVPAGIRGAGQPVALVK